MIDTSQDHQSEAQDAPTRGWQAFALAPRTAWIVAVVPLLVGLGLIGGLGQATWERTPLDQLPAGMDSTEGIALAQELPESDGSSAVIVFAADEGELDQAQIGELGALMGSYSEGEPVLIPSEDGTAALGILSIDSASASEVSEQVTELRANLEEDTPDGVTAQVTGPAGVEADLASVFEGANFRLLAVTASVVAVLLIITYRSPVLWILPLLVVGVADQAAAVSATWVLKAFDIPWNESTIGILSVLVFGAGTNYALLLISRYRDELKIYDNRYEAMRVAARRTAEPVLLSAGTVVAGVLTLLLSLTPTTRGLGLACAVGVTVAAFYVLVCLPSVLVLFPRGIFWPKRPRVGDITAAEAPSVWRRIGGVVAKRPVIVGSGVVVLLAAFAVGNAGIKLGLDTSDQFLSTPEAITAAERIAESYPAGTASPTLVTTTGDAEALAGEIEQVDGVASVMPSASGNGVSQVQVVLTGAEGSPEAVAAIDGLREVTAGYEETYVSGPEAETRDATDAANRDRFLIVPLILVLVLVSLAALLRAIVAPILLVATVVGTYFASLGVSWWLFTGVLGFEGLAETVPLYAFLFLVALGVDYNIFLVTRAREEAVGYGTRDGMLRALGATGGVITSAGILLAAVFATLGVLPLVVLAQLGVVVCIGVLLDTLLVRTMLVPALALVLGDAFWWPRKTVQTVTAA
ncbi:MMPL family transporter [Serinibacter salmoneus]|uniref:RND superfamily putative drug exporter n=1 Tax=Serinibacter salmoneus TaxID=556530 RepID=A0A2A9D1N4_9MICO|nr:MMPL family transporter [Serinibacter salmoneus]PFG20165.1 RND superfamily putative drug exporter [Serinibacter salmoneus]